MAFRQICNVPLNRDDGTNRKKSHDQEHKRVQDNEKTPVIGPCSHTHLQAEKSQHHQADQADHHSDSTRQAVEQYDQGVQYRDQGRNPDNADQAQ